MNTSSQQTLTLEEALKRATKGPLLSEGYKIARPSDMEVIARMSISVPSYRALPTTEEATATASLLTHWYNLGTELVEMLRIFHAAYHCDDHCAECADDGVPCIHDKARDLLSRASTVTLPSA